MKLRHLLPFFLLLLLTACADESQQETPPEAVNQLLGRWEIMEATRNGRPTDNLTDAFLEIRPEGALLVNLDGNPQEANWELNGQTLAQTNSRLDIDYTIQELSDSLMILSMNIRSAPFVMKFKKAADKALENTVQ